MKPIQLLRNYLTLTAFLLSAAACRELELSDIDADVEIQDVVTTDLGNGEKKLDFTVVVTQFGNAYFQDYKMTFTKFNDPVVIDSSKMTLPTAREFVKHSVQPVQSGDYYAFISLKAEGISNGFGKVLKVP
jgi:hypothetical protein